MLRGTAGRAAIRTRALHALAFAIVLVCSVAAGTRAAPVDEKAYVLGPGDSVEIVVYGQADLSETVTIKPDGMVALPLVGEIKAAGLTTAQLEQALVKAYLKYLKAPSVSVKVSQFRTNRIYVLGQVSRPGQYELKPNAGVFELIAAAGGPTLRADLAKAVLIRDKTDTTQLDLLSAIKQSKDPAVSLQPDDVLYIPETDSRIIVLGEVNHPGAYDLLEGQRVTDLIAGAGGPTTKAALAQAFVVRGQQQIPVDLQKALAGDASADIVLQPRDMMVVPESRARIAVLGAVNRPGPYDYKTDMKIVDAIALAGGQTTKADLNRVQVVRAEGGQAKTINVNFTKVLKAQDLSQNIALQNGDIVYVTPKGFTFDLFGGLVNIYYLLRTAAGF
jgi:polysaccharide export outer membrane protein